MAPELTSGIFGLGGVLLGGAISWWVQRDRASTDLRIALEAIKTEHMAEKTAHYYLSSERYQQRSFELLSRRLGGFTGDDLRRILVRAGGVRSYGADDEEFWSLVSRASDM